MKLIEPAQLKKEFDPFDITFKVESLGDARKLYFIFNYQPLIRLLGFYDISNTVRSFLKQKDINVESAAIFNDFVDALEEDIR